MTDSNNSRFSGLALVREVRGHFNSPYKNPNIMNPKTTNTNSKPWNPECQDRFVKAIHQLGGIDKASPEAVVALMNNDDHHPLDLGEIACRMHIIRPYFKKIEGQQENPKPNMSSKKIEWNKDRVVRLIRVVSQLGGIDKASPQAILEAMKEHINDSFCLTVDEIANKISYLRESYLRESWYSKRLQEGLGYGPVRRSVSSVRSRPYDQGSVRSRIGSTSKGIEFEWTLDLHKRFVDTVEELGGVIKATAGAIMEMMQEEGLTRVIVSKHLRGLRQLLRGTKIVPSNENQAKGASSWSNSGSVEDVLNNFRELNLKPT